jgi:hypothetical protein
VADTEPFFIEKGARFELADFIKFERIGFIATDDEKVFVNRDANERPAVGDPADDAAAGFGKKPGYYLLQPGAYGLCAGKSRPSYPWRKSVSRV